MENSTRAALDAALNVAVAELTKTARAFQTRNPEANIGHALRAGFAAAINAPAKWHQEDAIIAARVILEDANCHTEAQALSESLS